MRAASALTGDPRRTAVLLGLAAIAVALPLLPVRAAGWLAIAAVIGRDYRWGLRLLVLAIPFASWGNLPIAAVTLKPFQLLTVATLAGLLLAARTGRLPARRATALDLPIVAWLVIMILSLVNSAEVGQSARFLVQYALLGSAVLVLTGWYPEAELPAIPRLLLCSAVAITPIQLVNLLGGNLNRKYIPDCFLEGGYASGDYLLFAIPLVLLAPLPPRSWWTRVRPVVVAVLLVDLLLTFNRSSWLSAGLVLLVLGFFHRAGLRRWWKAGAAVAVGTLATVAGLYLWSPAITPEFFRCEFIDGRTTAALVSAIGRDGYGNSPPAGTTPADEVRWLNALLADPEFPARWRARHGAQVALPEETRDQLAAWAERPEAVAPETLMGLNRQLLTRTYPRETPPLSPYFAKTVRSYVTKMSPAWLLAGGESTTAILGTPVPLEHWRLRLWANTVDRFVRPHWLIGSGIGIIAQPYFDPPTHNNLVQVLGETGIGGLAILLWLYGTAISATARHRAPTAGARALALAIRGALLGLVCHGLFFNTLVYFHHWFPLALAALMPWWRDAAGEATGGETDRPSAGAAR